MTGPAMNSSAELFMLKPSTKLRKRVRTPWPGRRASKSGGICITLSLAASNRQVSFLQIAYEAIDRADRRSDLELGIQEICRRGVRRSESLLGEPFRNNSTWKTVESTILRVNPFVRITPR